VNPCFHNEKSINVKARVHLLVVKITLATSWVFSNHFMDFNEFQKTNSKALINLFLIVVQNIQQVIVYYLSFLYWWKNLQNSYEYVKHPFLCRLKTLVLMLWSFTTAYLLNNSYIDKVKFWNLIFVDHHSLNLWT
jgi:hypothetical protein